MAAASRSSRASRSTKRGREGPESGLESGSESGSESDHGAAASASSAAPAAVVGRSPGEPLKELSKFLEEVDDETRTKSFIILGVSVVVTQGMRQALALIYGMVSIPGVLEAVHTAIQSTFTWMTSVPTIFTPEFVVLSYMSSLLGGVFIKSVLVPIVEYMTKDPAIRATRKEMLTNIAGIVGTVSRTVNTTVAAQYEKLKASEVMAYLKLKFQGALESLPTLEALHTKITSLSLPTIPRMAGADIRQMIIDLRQAIYLWVLVQPITIQLRKKAATGDTLAQDHLNEIHALQGCIVTLISRLESMGVPTGEIETYIEMGLPGIIGKFADAWAVTSGIASDSASATATGVVEAGRSFLSIGSRLLYGDILTRPQTRSVVAEMDMRDIVQLNRVKKITRYFIKRGVTPPPLPAFVEAGPGAVVTVTRTKSVGGFRELLEDINDFGGKDDEMDGFIDEIIVKYPWAEDLKEDIREQILQHLEKETSTKRSARAAPGAEGRHTARKHKTRKHKKNSKSTRRRRRKPVTHRRGKRGNRRRRTNRRPAKRSKK